MSFPRYPAYKPSSVEWLGEVPDHWDVLPLKREFAVVGGSTPKSDTQEYWDGDIQWVTPADLSRLHSLEITESIRTITAEGLNSCGTTIVPSGSVIVSTRAPIGSVGIAGIGLCTNQGCKALAPIGKSSPRFTAYFLGIATEALNVRERGTTFLELSGDELGAFKAPPPYQEQVQIASFLDRETAKIDALIAEQQRLIELLQEKRQAVISHAVTKGLNPDAPMKDSGVEWLGEVPEHWITTGKLCYYARLDTGSTPDRQRPEYWNGDIPWVKTGEVKYEDIRETEEKITELALQETSCSLQQPGTLLMALYGQGVTRGRVGMLMTAATCNQACAAITPSPSVDGRYLEIYLTNAYSHLRSLGNETTQQNLNLDFVGKLELLIPPLTKQECIWQTAKQRTGELDALLLQSADAIALLQERRSALISAAVTGQIDVRGLLEEAC